MVCTSLGSLLRPLFYFLCYIHFSLSVQLNILYEGCGYATWPSMILLAIKLDPQTDATRGHRIGVIRLRRKGTS